MLLGDMLLGGGVQGCSTQHFASVPEVLAQPRYIAQG